MITHCPHCDAEVPPDSAFCPTCGQPLPQVATGATQQLQEQPHGAECSRCGALNPRGAQFCVACGTPLGARSAAPSPAVYERPTAEPFLVPEAPNLASTSHNVSSEHAGQGNMWSNKPTGYSIGLFLLGLAVLAWTGWWWPGILVLFGLSTLLSSFGMSQPRAGISSGIWLLGLAVVAQFNWWWPGILVLFGLSALLEASIGGFRRRPT